MPHRRRVQKGSFGSHFDELLGQFSAEESGSPPERCPTERAPELQEKISIHAWLFQQAWQLEKGN